MRLAGTRLGAARLSGHIELNIMPAGLVPAQAGFREEAPRKATTAREWKAGFAKRGRSGEFATSARFRRDLEADYAAMSANLNELGLARYP